MKLRYKIFTVFALAITTVFQSCDKDFVDINTNPNNSVQAYPSQFMAPALVDAVSNNMTRNRTLNNELMQVTLNMGDGEFKIFRYDIRNNVSDGPWNGYYTELDNFKELYNHADGGVNDNASYRGIAMICQSWIYSILTDIYGDIPYSEAIRGKGDLILEPKFDAQKDIYLDLFQKLDSANALLAKNVAIDGSQDPVYAGNVSKWRKFGNSLYLRLLLRVSAKSDVADVVLPKIKQILETNTSSFPLMTSNDDSAILRWTGVPPYTSPYMNVRVQDFRASAISKFFIDNLVSWNDPRLNIPVYGTNGVNRLGIAPVDGNFTGVPGGYAPGSGFQKLSYFYSTDQTVNNTPVRSMMSEALTGMIMNFSELQYIKAEIAIKGFAAGNPGALYKSGVESNIKLWLPNYAESIDTYLNDADINWDDNMTFDQKMQFIHLQKYYAMLFADCQQWFEYRRTGYPLLPKGDGLLNNGEMPARLKYPIYVQSANPTNYKKAVSQQGEDEIYTKVWWQRP